MLLWVMNLGFAGGGSVQQTQENFYYYYDQYDKRRRKRIKEIREALEAAEALENRVDAEIALLIHRKALADEERTQLDALKKLVVRHSKENLDAERVNRALRLAAERQTLSSFEALRREYERMQEDEDIFVLLTLLH